jgi:uncharacterized membrane protein
MTIGHKVLLVVLFFITVTFFFLLGAMCERAMCKRKENTKTIKSDENYMIVCENGLQYKIKNNIAFPVLNTDGTQAKCDTIH